MRLLSCFRPTAAAAFLLAVGAIGTARPAHAQSSTDGLWNGDRALELVARARETRRSVVVDSLLRTYQSSARGFVYFFLDRNDSDERTLVKTDQVALDVYWRAPGDTRQRIVGLRDEKTLPTNIQYHLDHLTVVQDEFGDRIRLGDGDEVAAVMHPVATGAESTYDYRLADSLTLEFGGTQEPVRVYELEVRPRRLDQPGFVGSLYLDRATASIVRMNFTFTPASYVDPYLDYIRISLDNVLWMGRFWLPYRQEAELRRELPQLDFLAGSVIRGRFEIGDYRFNEELPDALFGARTVLAAPEAERRAYPFDEPIFAGLEAEGLDPSASMEELTAQVRTIVRDQALSGLRPARFYWASVSDAVRYSRAEGVYLGAGTSLRTAGLGLRLHGGWSFGREDLSARVEARLDDRAPATRLVAEWRGLRDIGPLSASSGLFNTVASLAGEDWTDPWFVTGARLEHRVGGIDGVHLVATASWLDQRSARLVVGDAAGVFRPVRPIEEGIARALEGTLVVPEGPGGLQGSATVRASRLGGRSWMSTDLRVEMHRLEPWRSLDLRASLRGGWSGADAPPQAWFLLGGRGTLPGHAHRAFVGTRYWLADARVGRPVAAPWIGAHLTAAVGQATVSAGEELPPGWTGDLDAGVRASVGLGVDLFWDVLTVDVARGLGPDGDWALLVGVAPRFHPWL